MIVPDARVTCGSGEFAIDGDLHRTVSVVAVTVGDAVVHCEIEIVLVRGLRAELVRVVMARMINGMQLCDRVGASRGVGQVDLQDVDTILRDRNCRRGAGRNREAEPARQINAKQ